MQGLGFSTPAAFDIKRACDTHEQTPAFNVPSPVKSPPHGPIGRKLFVGELQEKGSLITRGMQPEKPALDKTEEMLCARHIDLVVRFGAMATDCHNAQQHVLSLKNENAKLRRELQIAENAVSRLQTEKSALQTEWQGTVDQLQREKSDLQSELQTLQSGHDEQMSTNQMLVTAVQKLQTKQLGGTAAGAAVDINSDMGVCVQCGVVTYSPNYSGGMDTFRCWECRPSNFERGRVCIRKHCRAMASQRSRGPKPYCDQHLLFY